MHSCEATVTLKVTVAFVFMHLLFNPPSPLRGTALRRT